MKKRFIIFHAVPAALFIGIVFSFFLGNGAAFGQGRVSRIVKVTPAGSGPSSEKTAINAKFAAAAAENSNSVSNLNWTFGGRVQTGWQIYTPLVAETIGVHTDAATPEFAAALSK